MYPVTNSNLNARLTWNRQKNDSPQTFQFIFFYFENNNTGQIRFFFPWPQTVAHCGEAQTLPSVPRQLRDTMPPAWPGSSPGPSWTISAVCSWSKWAAAQFQGPSGTHSFMESDLSNSVDPLTTYMCSTVILVITWDHDHRWGQGY